jgi:type I restriction enzyme, S subunit
MSGELPAGWTAATLGQVVDRPRAKAAPSAHPELPFVGMDSIAPGGMDLLSVGRFGDMKSAGGVFEPGDVLYGRMRPYLNKVHLAKQRGACSAEFIVVPPGPSIRGDFLAYLIHQQSFVNFASEQSSGDRPRVDFESLAPFEFGLPPKPEQQRIVSRIEELFSEIDEGERALERVGQLVERYRQSVLKAAVTGELTAVARAAGEFEGETGADALERALNRRAHLIAQKLSRSEPVLPDVAGLPALPTGWVWASVDQLCGYFGNGLSRKPAHEPPGNPILRISAVRPLAVDALDLRYYVAEPGEQLDNCFVESGDLLFTRYNGSRELVGVSGVYRGQSPVLHPDKLIRARVISSCSVLPDYLEIALNAGETWKLLTSCVKTSAGQHGIAGADIKRAPVPLPPFNEQRQIVALWRHIESQIGALAGSVPAESRRGQALRQAVLKAAFSGQLVPQDPRDEPASALLARLAAQAAEAPAAPRRRGRPAGRRLSQPNPAVAE